MSTHNRPSTHNTRTAAVTFDIRFGGAMPTTGVLNGASNAESSAFSDFSGSFERVEQYTNMLQSANASYKDCSGEMARCLVATRKGVLNELKLLGIDSTRPIFWLNGPDGKSTLAQTVAEWRADEGRLVASFFFFRGTGNRDKVSRFIPTLTFQLSITIENMEPLVKNFIARKPFLADKDARLSYRFDNAAVRKPTVILVVIDALDECEIRDGGSINQSPNAAVEACIMVYESLGLRRRSFESTLVKVVQEEEGMPHQMLLGALQTHGLDPLYICLSSSFNPFSLFPKPTTVRFT
ncbi:hypothetical protein SERLADRAFT_414651 [Serpula lacrymans var. lacrymans S7.9]|uniref:Nephrocystin 3-like N-terminal domain-containing protein n=1 Tax=Serpula lacrymans var. lacrymans (strain S7.9) TaxID=578457 RepID=F8NR93_SERL9|nr:uncharacterized protein SERLADRAFT_414651 [Serpula lacrymans var. lacrymans S7.9]EGO26740.1 hypothetical protein SERLADRAFT_414651 [Serpula lacrymans var. lacrymans S7.9]